MDNFDLRKYLAENKLFEEMSHPYDEYIKTGIEMYSDENYREEYIESPADVYFGIEQGDKELTQSVFDTIVAYAQSNEKDLDIKDLAQWFIDTTTQGNIDIQDLIN